MPLAHWFNYHQYVDLLFVQSSLLSIPFRFHNSCGASGVKLNVMPIISLKGLFHSSDDLSLQYNADRVIEFVAIVPFYCLHAARRTKPSKTLKETIFQKPSGEVNAGAHILVVFFSRHPRVRPRNRSQ